MSADLPLQIQMLGGFVEQTLVLLHVAGLQASTKSVTPATVLQLFIDLRLPKPAKVANHLASLEKSKLAMRPDAGRWAVTPAGREKIRELMLGVSDEQLKEIAKAGGDEPVFGDARHHLIPTAMAPASFRRGLGRF